MARHFVDYLEPPGRYVGMDIQRPFIDWCNENLASENPAFEFHHQDIYNGGYNPEGKTLASEYRFPFEDGSFDAVILYSVFTHLLPEDADNYRREIARLLKPGGRCYSTWYLLTEDREVEYLIPHIKEGQVGYGFPHCAKTLEACGLRVEDYRIGRWNGGESDIWQDLLWLRKAEEVPARYPIGEPDALANTGEQSTFSGVVERLDPVANSLVVAGGGSRVEVGFSRQTEVRAHGGPGGLADLRLDQQAEVIYAGGSSGRGHALEVVVRGRPKAERIQGIVEAVDWDAGVITLSIPDEGSTSVRFDPDRMERVAINHKRVGLEELKPGQLAGVFVVPMAQAVEALDAPSEGT
jgi:SAM-dependent methyltransferase